VKCTFAHLAQQTQYVFSAPGHQIYSQLYVAFLLPAGIKGFMSSPHRLDWPWGTTSLLFSG